MNVLVISHSSVVGSYQGKLHMLANRFGVKVDLIVPPSWNEGGRTIAAQDKFYPTFTTHIVPAYRLNRIASYWYHPFKFQQLVSTISPSLIYVEEEPWSIAAWQAVRSGITLHVPVLFFTWENNWIPYKQLSQKILQYVLTKSSGAIAGNRDAELILKKKGFLKPLLNAPQYGVDVSLFHEHGTKCREAGEKPTIIFLGRLEKEKGVDILLRAVSKLSHQCNLLILGRGPAKQELLTQSKQLGIEQQVTFIDAIEHPEVPAYLRRAEILVLPSLTFPRWKEQFGRVLVEAMACGTAVIGSNSGAIPEVIGDAGLIFREGNSDDLAERISILLNNSTLRGEYRSKGITRVRDHYTDASIAGRLYDFFSSILEQSR